MRVLVPIVLSVIAPLVAGFAIQPTTFDPYAYKLTNTLCPAVDHGTGQTKIVNIG